MIGSLLYLTFDITFNLLLWITIKGAKGIYYITNSIIYYNDNTNDLEKREIEKIQEQIIYQNKLIKELKKKIDEKDKLKKVRLYYSL